MSDRNPTTRSLAAPLFCVLVTALLFFASLRLLHQLQSAESAASRKVEVLAAAAERQAKQLAALSAAVAAAEVTPPPRPAPPARSGRVDQSPDLLSPEFLSDPHYLELAYKVVEGDMLDNYGQLLARLPLAPEKRTLLARQLCERMMSTSTLAVVAKERGYKFETRDDRRKAMMAVFDAIDRDIAERVGPEVPDAIRQYDRIERERRWVNSFRSRWGAGAEPLSSAQADALLSLVVGEGASKAKSGAVSSSFVEQAARMLSPAQMRSLNEFLEESKAATERVELQLSRPKP